MVGLDDLVCNFFRTEVIEDYECDQCGKHTRISKSHRLCRLPEVLVVFIKRFRLYPLVEKNNNLVSINSLQLDLVDFLFSETKMDPELKNLLCEERDKAVYSLVGFVEHFGSIDFGHYTCVCRNDYDGDRTSEWVLFNDESLHSVDEKKEVLTSHSDVYMLVYRRGAG